MFVTGLDFLYQAIGGIRVGSDPGKQPRVRQQPKTTPRGIGYTPVWIRLAAGFRECRESQRSLIALVTGGLGHLSRPIARHELAQEKSHPTNNSTGVSTSSPLGIVRQPSLGGTPA